MDNIEKEFLSLFEEYAVVRWRLLNEGNIKISNEYYDKLKDIEKKLAVNHCIDLLKRYLEDDNIAVRFEAAVILAKNSDKKAIKVLKELALDNSLIGFTAKMTIHEQKSIVKN